jgi:hypothetical protein
MMTIAKSEISKNHLMDKGSYNLKGVGIANHGHLLLINSTISGNTAHMDSSYLTAIGGGIYNEGQLEIYFSSIIGNSVTNIGGGGSQGGGLFLEKNYSWDLNPVEIKATLIANNISDDGSDCKASSGTITSKGYNLFSDTDGCVFIAGPGDRVTSVSDIDFSKLENAGGPTATHALSEFSVARNTISGEECLANNSSLVSEDQRGKARDDGECDTGAFEF